MLKATSLQLLQLRLQPWDPDTTAPTLSSFTLSDAGGGAVSGSFTTSEAGYFRVVFLADGSAAPTKEDIAGVNAGSIPGYFGGFEGSATVGSNPTGGTGYEGQTFDVYLVIWDASDNISEVSVVNDLVVAPLAP